ncbi:alpha/beta fold hydrolase [Cellulophaga sp. Hel_I_12]|uniref:alpha/beta fold hydrolase n=1 Tax=Cellulophaga sp. Hel_I_12 TaxID=1249972 RepID=UPI000647C9F7|nr:alpha/beta hydrolase [Cellulophaga sp. Hel_I_12]
MKYVIKTVKVLLLCILISSTAIILLFGHRDIPLNDLKPKYANKASSFIAVHGMDVHFRDEGDPSDPIPLVLIHGTGSSLHTFDVWAERLKKTNRVIRMDLPAYGLTGSFPDHNYSMTNYTVFLKDFLIALGIKKCILIGNSLGGQIAWNFTLEQPNTVAKLILIDAAGYPKKSKSEPVAFKVAKTPVLNKLLTYVTPRFLVRASVENVYFNTLKVTDSLVDRYFELTLRAGNRQAFVDRFKMSVDGSSLTKIKDIQQPTLILWGEKDLLIPVEYAYKFQEDLPNDTLVILNNTGHTPMEESPFESLIPVINFINKQHSENHKD